MFYKPREKRSLKIWFFLKEERDGELGTFVGRVSESPCTCGSHLPRFEIRVSLYLRVLSTQVLRSRVSFSRPTAMSKDWKLRLPISWAGLLHCTFPHYWVQPPRSAPPVFTAPSLIIGCNLQGVLLLSSLHLPSLLGATSKECSSCLHCTFPHYWVQPPRSAPPVFTAPSLIIGCSLQGVLLLSTTGADARLCCLAPARRMAWLSSWTSTHNRVNKHLKYVTTTKT